MQYCSRTCQKEDWKLGHKKACKEQQRGSGANRGGVAHQITPTTHRLEPEVVADTCTSLSAPGVCLARAAIFEKQHFYCAFGTTPPTYVLPGVSADASVADVLLLASGDLRSALYSLARDAQLQAGVRFVVNDSDGHVVARNVLLLWLAHHTTTEVLFSVWFSLGLTATATAAVRYAITSLTGPAADKHLAEIGAHFRTPSDREQVSAVLQSWVDLKLPWVKAQVMRTRAIASHLKIDPQELVSRLTTELHVRFQIHSMSMEPSEISMTALETELAAYAHDGVISPLSDADAVTTTANPTLFKSKSRYDLHYASIPFFAFALHPSLLTGDRPLATHCHHELDSWVRALKARALGGGVNWTFAVGDGLRMCAALMPRHFDVVCTSDAADSVGLLPLLQAARMVTRPTTGVLLTETLLYLTYAEHADDYLRQNLVLEPELWPGVLGWRCLGHEGGLAPLSSEVMLEMIDWVTHSTKSIRGGADGSKIRGSTRFTWVPAAASNVPLLLDTTVMPGLDQLVRSCRLTMATLPFGGMAVPTPSPLEVRDGFSRLHLHTLLPLLLSAVDPESLLSDTDVELRHLMQWVKGTVDLVVVSVPVDEDSLLWTPEESPHLCAILTIANRSTILYSGVWLDVGKVAGERVARFLVHPAMLPGATATLVGCSPHRGGLGMSDTLVGEPCVGFSPPLLGWLRDLRGNITLDGMVAHRTEEKHCWRISVDLAGPWLTAVDAGKVPSASAADSSTGIHLSIPGTELEVLVHLPSPVCADRIRVVLSQDHCNLTVVVRKAKFLFGTRARAELWLDDRESWQPCRPRDDFMVTVSGFQMSPKERFISRSRTGPDVPPLIALKDSVMMFFQFQDEVAFHLSVPDVSNPTLPNMKVLVLHHGIRREHRSGTIVADLSFCFLSEGSKAKVVPWWQSVCKEHSSRGQSAGRHILCAEAEIALCQQFVSLFASRAKDITTWLHPPNRRVVPQRLRRHFDRVLFPPLFAHETALVELFSSAMASTSGEAKLDVMRQFKDEGSAFIKLKDYRKAADSYQQALSFFLTSPEIIERKAQGTLGAAESLLSAQCYLNLALCLLRLSEPREVVVCCEAAHGLLMASEHALLSKCHYRMGLALEQLADFPASETAFAAALEVAPGDEGILKCLTRVRSLQAAAPPT